MDNSSGVALGNLHPDSMPGEANPEIVTVIRGGGTIAWRRTADDGSAWEEMWRNTTYPTSAQNSSGAQPSLRPCPRSSSSAMPSGRLRPEQHYCRSRSTQYDG